MRNQDGTPGADCRVNGDDWESGAQALRNYVGTWPQAGFELRKQYVVLQTMAQSRGRLATGLVQKGKDTEKGVQQENH